VIVYASLLPEDRATITAFEAALHELDDVVERHRMFSEPDYLLRVAVADLAAYERVYTDRLASLPGVARLTSQIAMKTVKPDGRLPL
jgi:Lrp/AsnC family leucine-responsive transcriptional regulator